MKKPRTTYSSRIGKVLLYIDRNLEKDLSLTTVCKIAHYSPFHFHRIFVSITNETLNDYVTRKRIEKAASILIRKKEISITELSTQYGFNSNASFTKTFKAFYGLPPSKFREKSSNKFTKVKRSPGKKSETTFERYVDRISENLAWMKQHADVSVRILDPFRVAYITNIGNVNAIGKTFEKLITWAKSKNVFNAQPKLLTVYHDSLKISDPARARQSACIMVNTSIKQDEEVAIMTINGGKYLVARAALLLAEFEYAWISFFVWISEHGHTIREEEIFEIYHNDPTQHPEGKCHVDLCVPIK
jgi:AraC family transcriptional regulator